MALAGGLENHQTSHSRAMRVGLLVGVGALGLFLLLRAHSGAAGPASPDLAQAAQAAAQQQAQQDQVALGTPAGGPGGADQLGAAVSEGLSGVASSLSELQAQVAQGQGQPTPSETAVASSGALGMALTAAIQQLGNGQHASGAASPAASGGRAGTITTHAGGAFYRWYRSVFGTPPPANLPASNLRYQAWKRGVPKATARRLPNR